MVRIGRIGPDPDPGGWWWVVLVIVGVVFCIAVGAVLVLIAIKVVDQLA